MLYSRDTIKLSGELLRWRRVQKLDIISQVSAAAVYVTCLTPGSADQLVILWDETGQPISKFKGYPEPVRGLALLSDHETFVSACNDG